MFDHDDPYNIYWYWSRGPWALLKGILLFYSNYYRPIGGVYFYTLYTLFGFNPFPFHVVIASLFLLNTILIYRCAAILSSSKISDYVLGFKGEKLVILKRPGETFIPPQNASIEFANLY